MEFFIIYVFLMILMILFFLWFFFKFIKKSSNRIDEKLKNLKGKEDNYLVIDELRKHLKQDPSDYKARITLFDKLFEMKMYLPAVKEALFLVDASAATPDIDEKKYTTKVGEGYYYLKNYQEAKKFFKLSKKMDETEYVSNMFLAKIEYETGGYLKALPFLKLALQSRPDDIEALRLKGLSAFQENMYKESINALAKVIDKNPGDEEAIYHAGFALYKLNKFSSARKILQRIEESPKYSKDVEYFIGMILFREKSYMKSIEKFEKLIQITGENYSKILDVYYTLGECHVQMHDIPKALVYFEKGAKINNNYKDISKKIETYSHLNKNSLLEKYTIGSNNQFTNICKLFAKYYVQNFSMEKGRIKLGDTKITQTGELELRLEVSSGKFVTMYYFVFFRNDTTVGELIVRNIYNMLREEKIDKGICVTPGSFSDAAVRFIESRMLEVVEKKQLSQILEKIGTKLKS